MTSFEVVVNPAAGRGSARELLPTIERALDDLGLAYHVSISRSRSDPAGFARRAAEAGATVVAVGGDGMVGMVADALAGTGATLGVIAAGTGNDFAMSVGLPIKEPDEACRVLRDGVARDIDLGLVSWRGCSRHFLGVAGAGFDSEANRWANGVTWMSGRPLYTVAALRTLARWSPRPFTVTTDGTATTEYDAWLVTVANGTTYGGGMKIAPRARLDDGALNATVVGAMGKLELLRAFPRVFRGTHVSHPRVDTWTAREIRIEGPADVDCYADGELCGPLPVAISVVPAALRLLVRS